MSYYSSYLGRRTGVTIKFSCSVQTSRIWETYINIQSEHLNLEKKIDESTDVYITIRPGLWTDAFLNKAGCEAKKALYQFGYLAKQVLAIDPYHNGRCSN